MKRSHVFTALILLAAILSGCDSSTVNSGNTYVLGQDDQFYFNKSANSQSMAESEDGYYFLSGPYSLYLFYMDKKTMKPAILCNKPDCLHTDETDMYKIADCNAFSNTENLNLIYYNSYLYMGGTDSLSGGAYSIYQISHDGTKKTKIYTFKDSVPETWMIHRGYIYYTTNDNGTVQGQEATTQSNCMLCRIDLNNIGKGPCLLHKTSGVDANTYCFFGYLNSVYWLVGALNKTLTEYANQAYRYNILDGKTDLLGNDIDYLGACGGQLVFQNTNGIMYKSDLDGSDKKEIGKIRNDYDIVFTDGRKYIYCETQRIDTNGSANKRVLRVYDLQGVLVNTIDIHSLGKDISYGCNGDYFFIPDNRSASNEHGNILTLWAIDEKNIESGTPAIEKIFEFVPKVQFTVFATKPN